MSSVSENGYAERARQLERRMDKSEDDRAEIWRHQGSLERSYAVLAQQLKDLGQDVKDLADEIHSAKRAMWSVAIGSFGVVIALCTLIVQQIR
jgi:septal ring factor EnvC (AmiA/AmiB activator)